MLKIIFSSSDCCLLKVKINSVEIELILLTKCYLDSVDIFTAITPYQITIIFFSAPHSAISGDQVQKLNK